MSRMANAVSLLRTHLYGIRHALHIVRCRPTVVATAILTLTLGIGLPIAVFASLDSLVAPSLRGRYASLSDRLVRVPAIGSYAAYAYARDSLRTLTVSVTVSVSAHLEENLGAEPLTVECVSASFLDLLDATPLMGRSFAPFDDVPGAAPVALLAHDAWRRVFGGRPDVIGTIVRLDARPHTVIGVMPADFHGIHHGASVASRPADAWTLVEASPRQCLGLADPHDEPTFYLQTIGRLRHPFTLADARRELLAHRGMLQSVTSSGWLIDIDDQWVVAPMYGPHRDTPHARLMGWAGTGAVAVAGLACSTVALLLLLSALQRRPDMATRLQMGARRSHIFLQLCAEAAVIGALCAAPTVIVALWVASLADTLVPVDALGRILTPRRVAAAAGVAVTAGIVAGLGAAVAGAWTRSEGVGGRTVGPATKSQAILLDVVVASQVAVAIALVTLAGTFVRSAVSVRQAAGYDVDHLIVAAALTSPARWDDPSEAVRRGDSLATARARVGRLPSVAATALSSGSPLGTGAWTSATVWGPRGRGTGYIMARITEVTPGYFETTGTRILRGRPFRTEDARTGTPAVIVGERVASRLWPANDALGACLHGGGGILGECARVVGIAQARRYASIMEYTDEIFLPLPATAAARADDGERAEPSALLVRTRVPSRDAIGAVAAAVRSVPGAPGVDRPGFRIRRLADLAGEQTRVLSLATIACVLFGVLGVVLATIGVYATTATMMRQRIPEMGIRMAVGATSGDIAWLVARRGLGVLVVGTAVGGLVAGLSAPVVAAVLVDVAPVEWPVLLGAAAVVVVAVAGAVGVVAVRAGRLSPAVAGREDSRTRM